MERRQLGRTDLQLSEIGLGCWVMGKAGWIDVQDEESIAAIQSLLPTYREEHRSLLPGK